MDNEEMGNSVKNTIELESNDTVIVFRGNGEHEMYIPKEGDEDAPVPWLVQYAVAVTIFKDDPEFVELVLNRLHSDIERIKKEVPQEGGESI